MVVSETEDMPRTNCTLFIMNMIYSIKCCDTQLSILFCQAVWEVTIWVGNPSPIFWGWRSSSQWTNKDLRWTKKTHEKFTKHLLDLVVLFFSYVFFCREFLLRHDVPASMTGLILLISSGSLREQPAVGSRCSSWKRLEKDICDHNWSQIQWNWSNLST